MPLYKEFKLVYRWVMCHICSPQLIKCIIKIMQSLLRMTASIYCKVHPAQYIIWTAHLRHIRTQVFLRILRKKTKLERKNILLTQRNNREALLQFIVAIGRNYLNYKRFIHNIQQITGNDKTLKEATQNIISSSGSFDVNKN